MGLGVMGQAAARALAVFGYKLNGWSRSPRVLAGIACYAGREQLDAFLHGTDILVCLLPLTPDTSGILNRRLFANLSQGDRSPHLPGPALINAGRGGLQVETDILAALDEGMLYAASLDVFREEPLPATSPLWSHPRVLVTPHVASETDPDAIARYTLRQIANYERGQPLENAVARERGY
jgi:glyoxylate/hydroxypyruvate reductase